MAGEMLTDSMPGGSGMMLPTRTPLALVIAPTRELALQVSRELAWLYAGAQARIATCVGGMDASKERRELQRGAHIVVGTPGRLRDHLERGALDLSTLKAVVLDEADEMLDMGFREDLEEILDATPGRTAHPAVLRHHAQADHRTGQALSARCVAHLDGR
jgi:ATP-dependent RNA helicase DeaD